MCWKIVYWLFSLNGVKISLCYLVWKNARKWKSVSIFRIYTRVDSISGESESRINFYFSETNAQGLESGSKTNPQLRRSFVAKYKKCHSKNPWNPAKTESWVNSNLSSYVKDMLQCPDYEILMSLFGLNFCPKSKIF